MTDVTFLHPRALRLRTFAPRLTAHRSPSHPLPKKKRVALLYIMMQSLSFVRGGISPETEPSPSRCTTELGATGPAFPVRRSAARLSPRSAALLYMLDALFQFSTQKTHSQYKMENALVLIGRSSDRDLVEVPDGIHGLGEPTIRRALRP